MEDWGDSATHQECSVSLENGVLETEKLKIMEQKLLKEALTSWLEPQQCDILLKVSLIFKPINNPQNANWKAET